MTNTFPHTPYSDYIYEGGTLSYVDWIKWGQPATEAEFVSLYQGSPEYQQQQAAFAEARRHQRVHSDAWYANVSTLALSLVAQLQSVADECSDHGHESVVGHVHILQRVLVQFGGALSRAYRWDKRVDQRPHVSALIHVAVLSLRDSYHDHWGVIESSVGRGDAVLRDQLANCVRDFNDLFLIQVPAHE
jgi:hypothetical protein